MKAAIRYVLGLFLLASLGATLGFTQTLPHFDHIIIVFQENRTPDDLFGSGPQPAPCNSEQPFEQGVDIEDGGYTYNHVLTCLTALHLNDPKDR